jgi:hypothetical protein
LTACANTFVAARACLSGAGGGISQEIFMSELPHTPPVKMIFNLRALSGKGIALVLEHLPCCLLSLAAASVGIPFLNHNTYLELGFAIGGAIAGEYIGHRYIFNKHCHGHKSAPAWRRYAIALAIGLATWGAHQIYLHEPAERHVHAPAEVHASHAHAQAVTASKAISTTASVY